MFLSTTQTTHPLPNNNNNSSPPRKRPRISTDEFNHAVETVLRANDDGGGSGMTANEIITALKQQQNVCLTQQLIQSRMSRRIREEKDACPWVRRSHGHYGWRRPQAAATTAAAAAPDHHDCSCSESTTSSSSSSSFHLELDLDMEDVDNDYRCHDPKEPQFANMRLSLVEFRPPGRSLNAIAFDRACSLPLGQCLQQQPTTNLRLFFNVDQLAACMRGAECVRNRQHASSCLLLPPEAQWYCKQCNEHVCNQCLTSFIFSSTTTSTEQEIPNSVVDCILRSPPLLNHHCKQKQQEHAMEIELSRFSCPHCHVQPTVFCHGLAAGRQQAWDMLRMTCPYCSQAMSPAHYHQHLLGRSDTINACSRVPCIGESLGCSFKHSLDESFRQHEQHCPYAKKHLLEWWSKDVGIPLLCDFQTTQLRNELDGNVWLLRHHPFVLLSRGSENNHDSSSSSSRNMQ